MKTLRITGWLIIFCLLVVLIALWFLSPTIQPRFDNLAHISVTIGQLLGLVGVFLLSINFIISTRLQFVDWIFYGLNNAYKKHSQIGQLALILLIFHPLFLLPKYAPDLPSAAKFLWFSSNWAINFGILALWSFIFLVILTLYLRPKYHIWKWTHKLMGLAFLLGIFHVWLIPSDTAHFLPLRIYVLTILFVGLMAYIYRSLLGTFLIKRYKYIVSNVTKLNKDIVELELKPKYESMKFREGQYVFFNLKSTRQSRESHPFSISSSSEDANLHLTIKKSGDYTNHIDTIIAGTVAELEGPFGKFSYKDVEYRHQIWIAGGIGITPFLSMARTLTKNSDYTVSLIYCVRNRAEAIHLDTLENIAENTNRRLQIIPFYSDGNGHITADKTRELCGNFNDTDIFVCAPPQMISSLRKQFINGGVDKRYIHSEEFDF